MDMLNMQLAPSLQHCPILDIFAWLWLFKPSSASVIEWIHYFLIFLIGALKVFLYFDVYILSFRSGSFFSLNDGEISVI